MSASMDREYALLAAYDGAWLQTRKLGWMSQQVGLSRNLHQLHRVLGNGKSQRIASIGKTAQLPRGPMKSAQEVSYTRMCCCGKARE